MWQQESGRAGPGALLRAIPWILLLWLMPFIAMATDIHWLWDDRCAECHGHSAEFSRKFLRISENRLQGRHDLRDLRLFLGNHYTPRNDVNAVYDMLLAQLKTPPRFRDECSACHNTAAAFIRASIVLHDGVLVGRATNQPINEFMQSHRGLEPDDIEFFVKLLNRVAAEVNGE